MTFCLTQSPHQEVKDVLQTMRSMAVIASARGVIRAELMQLIQSNYEPIRTLAARVRGKAETCGFTTTAKCLCGLSIDADYAEEATQDVVLAGIRKIWTFLGRPSACQRYITNL